jgi:alpha-glucosidase
LLLFSFGCFCVSANSTDKTFYLSSPDKKISTAIRIGSTVSYRLSYSGEFLTGYNHLSLNLSNNGNPGINSRFKNVRTHSVNKLVSPLFGMASQYRDEYNETILEFSDNFSIIFRAYNNGVAYRFVTRMKGRINVLNEQVEYRFEKNINCSVMKIGNFLTSYEDRYVDTLISFLDSNKIAALPMLVESNKIKLAVTEANLLDYPGLYLTYNDSFGLKSIFPNFVTKDSVGGCCPNFEKLPVQRAQHIAETAGTRSFPWRLLIIAKEDKDLLYNDLVYLLADENRIGDASWIKPGKVAWDWWAANNLTGVAFKTGFNTDTYKYFIDFAAANEIEYINMDEGWSDQFDLLKLNDGNIKIGTNEGGGLDMPFLFKYAKEKNVGIILWCVWHTLDRQMTEALDQFEKWGVKGLKVDFMDRDDQTIVNFYERLGREAAKRKMLVNFHGAYKPTGLERTYPNVINREAVLGLEYNKFSSKCTPENLAHIPYIRMLAGPMDYTPGGLTNANEKDFRIVNERPMTMGTRCQQLALYTILYAPLEMMADAPTAYEKEPLILKYIAGMPTVWDQTIPIAGKVGDYAVLARRKGSDWFVAGISDWTGRSIDLNFNFLGSGSYTAEIFTDGPNSNRIGNDYIRTVRQIKKDDTLSVQMLNGGGFAIRLNANDQSR